MEGDTSDFDNDECSGFSIGLGAGGEVEVEERPRDPEGDAMELA